MATVFAAGQELHPVELWVPHVLKMTNYRFHEVILLVDGSRDNHLTNCSADPAWPALRASLEFLQREGHITRYVELDLTTQKLLSLLGQYAKRRAPRALRPMPILPEHLWRQNVLQHKVPCRAEHAGEGRLREGGAPDKFEDMHNTIAITTALFESSLESDYMLWLDSDMMGFSRNTGALHNSDARFSWVEMGVNLLESNKEMLCVNPPWLQDAHTYADYGTVVPNDAHSACQHTIVGTCSPRAMLLHGSRTRSHFPIDLSGICNVDRRKGKRGSPMCKYDNWETATEHIWSGEGFKSEENPTTGFSKNLPARAIQLACPEGVAFTVHPADEGWRETLQLYGQYCIAQKEPNPIRAAVVGMLGDIEKGKHGKVAIDHEQNTTDEGLAYYMGHGIAEGSWGKLCKKLRLSGLQ